MHFFKIAVIFDTYHYEFVYIHIHHSLDEYLETHTSVWNESVSNHVFQIIWTISKLPHTKEKLYCNLL